VIVAIPFAFGRLAVVVVFVFVFVVLTGGGGCVAMMDEEGEGGRATTTAAAADRCVFPTTSEIASTSCCHVIVVDIRLGRSKPPLADPIEVKCGPGGRREGNKNWREKVHPISIFSGV
jgi:hypothetical protein